MVADALGDDEELSEEAEEEVTKVCLHILTRRADLNFEFFLFVSHLEVLDELALKFNESTPSVGQKKPVKPEKALESMMLSELLAWLCSFVGSEEEDEEDAFLRSKIETLTI
jgi:hypothetical protein